MTKKGVRLLALGSLVVFFMFLTSSDLGSLEQEKFKVLSSRLIILDEPPESEQEYEAYRYDAAKKGYVVVYAVMIGYTDSKDTEYFPWFNFSLKKVKKFLVRIDFMCSITAKVLIDASMIGTENLTMLYQEEVSVKKNTYYRQEFDLGKGQAQGVYDFIATIYPSKNYVKKFVGGGSTVAAARVEIKK